MEEDWVLDFDTGVDATNFVLIIISSSFNEVLGSELKIS